MPLSGSQSTVLQVPSQYLTTPMAQISLVGAGPGDVGLLTINALLRIQQAEIVLFDYLVSEQILSLLPSSCQRYCVGKKAGQHSMTQDATNQLLLKVAATGKRVLRLKGGDPFIFGRGAEEMQILLDQGHHVEVIPGITAASGCAAYAGIPLTHRDVAQSATVVTGFCKNEGKAPNWKQMAVSNSTVVVYMGLFKAAKIAAELIDNGRDASTPVAIIEKGCTPEQRVVECELQQLADTIAEHQIQSPALLVIGDVVSMRLQQPAEDKAHNAA
ncbi:uroporphyrinogen-III C-methyltransferase [Echinimonas agarilytica]|uniref:uroporphyrinogen-III C-methyltransferase n=1 Tax=Echinimonas agarilytica TaxID=1215918 RepID=A0AA42B6F3_9GAMM|nr:uroporphyrinogen-III C-methyltransferase [Echinimonas agarilytica]MCM2678730.1 uroporphyrinogen-III C-methyltransferase [Echinimonas agarilytica]